MECSVATAPWELNATEAVMELNATNIVGSPGCAWGVREAMCATVHWAVPRPAGESRSARSAAERRAAG